MKEKTQTVIGWKETVDLPDWGIESIVAKSDTGARRSALDVRDIVELPDGRVRFDVVLDRKDGGRTHTVVAPIAHQTHVRSSNGLGHERYFVRTRIRVGGRTESVEFSLVCRKHMSCRILLGRKALEGRFLVDASQKHLTRARRKARLIRPPETETHRRPRV